jgi:hypothetical protein
MSDSVTWFTRSERRKPPVQATGNVCPLGLCRHLADFDTLPERPELRSVCGHCAGPLPWGASVSVRHVAVPDRSGVSNVRRTRRQHVALVLTAALAAVVTRIHPPGESR